MVKPSVAKNKFRKVRAPSATKAVGGKVTKFKRAQGVNRAISTLSKQMRTLNATIETKYYSVRLFQNQYIYGGGLSNPGVVSHEYGLISPDVWNNFTMMNGSSVVNRIGAKVTPISFNLRGVIYAEPYDPTINNWNQGYTVRMIVFRDKEKPNNPDTSYMKKTLNGSEAGITGTVLNEMYPWNRSRYAIYATKDFKLSQPQQIIHQDPPATIQHRQYVVINSGNNQKGPLFRKFSVNLPCPRVIEWDSQTSYPKGVSLSVGFYLIRSNGIATSSSQKPARVDAELTLKYKDA